MSDTTVMQPRDSETAKGSGPARPAAWAANIWRDPVWIDAASIGDGAKRLRAIQRNWMLYAFHLHRRAALIEAGDYTARSWIVAFPRAALIRWADARKAAMMREAA